MHCLDGRLVLFAEDYRRVLLLSLGLGESESIGQMLVARTMAVIEVVEQVTFFRMN